MICVLVHIMTKKETHLLISHDQCKNCKSLIAIKDIPADSTDLFATYNREKCCTIQCLSDQIIHKKPLLH